MRMAPKLCTRSKMVPLTCALHSSVPKSRPCRCAQGHAAKPPPHVLCRFLVYVDGRLVAQMPPPNYNASSTDVNSLEIDGGDPLDVRPASCVTCKAGTQPTHVGAQTAEPPAQAGRETQYVTAYRGIGETSRGCKGMSMGARQSHQEHCWLPAVGWRRDLPVRACGRRAGPPLHRLGHAPGAVR